jgi:hypothetical protein
MPIHPSAPSIPLRADQICVYKTIDNRRIPLFIVEYKAPHKLALPHLRSGLREMNLKEEVVDRSTQPDQSDVDAVFQYHSDRLVAAVVTQVYSYMVESGLEYSYLTTGEAFVFLKVWPDQSDTVYYHLSDPTAEVAEATRLDEDYLSWTAVSQVLAFCLMAFQSQPHDQAWRREAMLNKYRWVVDDAAILRGISETERKRTPPGSAFIPRTYRANLRSPIMTRSRKAQSAYSCNTNPNEAGSRGDSPPESGEEEHPTPTRRGGKLKQSSPRRAARRNGGKSSQEHCQTRAYCTQICLRGLRDGGLLDYGCPNFAMHQHGKDRYHQLDQTRFRSLLCQQLKRDLDN